MQYGSQWEEARHGLNATLALTSISNSTLQQRELIENGITELPNTIDDESGLVIYHVAHQRHGGNYQVFSRRDIYPLPFHGLSLLRTCKQINSEASRILYGANSFAFRESIDNMTRPWKVTLALPYGMLRSSNKDEFKMPHVEQEIPKLLARMLERNDRPYLVQEGLLLSFLYRIGPTNANQISKITIEGDFKPHAYRLALIKTKRIGFAGILSIHTLVLNTLYPSLRSLTLHMEHGMYAERSFLWDYDIDQSSGKTNEEKFDETVGKIVEGPPSLQHLQLRNYRLGGTPLSPFRFERGGSPLGCEWTG